MNNNINVDRILKSYLKKDSSKCFRELPVKYQYQLIVFKYIMNFQKYCLYIKILSMTFQ